MQSDSRFPAPVYAETVLSINFTDAQRLFLESLLEIHYAHTLMLARQGIIPAESARACIEALHSLDRASLETCAYDAQFEDMFFYVESRLESLCGAENAGRMHTARSRNDIDLTMYRMCLRREVLALVEAIHSAKTALRKIAGENVETLILAYTHTQPAQPSTLAHYFLAIIECFERDEERLTAAFRTINRNPLGACAITTTGFPIDRDYTAELLGFEGLQLNSYGAIASSDYVTETAGVVATAMVNLGRFVQDLLLWCNPEVGFLKLSGAWVQISSIMPQKRNPVALEHTRILASKALAGAQGIFTAVHNTPFGDIVDCEDDLQPLVFSTMADAIRAFRLFAGLIVDCEINTARLTERANADFLTVTELADTITRREGVGFRAAHRLVSEAVRSLAGQYSLEGMVRAVEELGPSVLGRALTVHGDALLQALDARNFVAVRRIPGGPAPEAIRDALAISDEKSRAVEDWIAEKGLLLSSYRQRIQQSALESCL
ncbi:MAG: argininosuccinate lyase [Acidobacteriota bacterium]|nr:argininosuccinate lyase [Acidobacteriota bacterium]